MSTIIYMFKCILMFIITWLGIRIIGKKSITQMTGYELSAILLISNVAAEPIVYSIALRAFSGVISLSLITLFIGMLTLKSRFYNLNTKPSIVIFNGKILVNELKKNKMNISFLISMLRLQGYFKISEIEYAIIEPNGRVSVLPVSKERPLKPKEIKIQTPYEGLALPLILDGRIVSDNLNFIELDEELLKNKLNNYGIQNVSDVLIAQLDDKGNLYVSTKSESQNIPKDI